MNSVMKSGNQQQVYMYLFLESGIQHCNAHRTPSMHGPLKFPLSVTYSDTFPGFALLLGTCSAPSPPHQLPPSLLRTPSP